MRKLYYRKSVAREVADRMMEENSNLSIKEGGWEVESFNDEDEEMRMHYPCSGVTNAYQLTDENNEEVALIGYWDDEL